MSRYQLELLTGDAWLVEVEAESLEAARAIVEALEPEYFVEGQGFEVEGGRVTDVRYLEVSRRVESAESGVASARLTLETCDAVTVASVLEAARRRSRAAAVTLLNLSLRLSTVLETGQPVGAVDWRGEFLEGCSDAVAFLEIVRLCEEWQAANPILEIEGETRVFEVFSVCTDCLMGVEYGGEYVEGAPAGWLEAFTAAAAGRELATSGDSLEHFGKLPCELCGSGLAGDRFEVVELK